MPAAVVIWMALTGVALGAVGKDLAGKHFLHKLAIAFAADGDEHQHHVLHGQRECDLAQNALSVS
jgi:hypothetical protein